MANYNITIDDKTVGLIQNWLDSNPAIPLVFQPVKTVEELVNYLVSKNFQLYITQSLEYRNKEIVNILNTDDILREQITTLIDENKRMVIEKSLEPSKII